MASRRLEDLHPDTREKARKFLRLCAENNLEVLIYCTYRSNSEQDDLYAQGRTKPGKKVTNARGGQSAHNRVDEKGRPAARAFDGVPLVGGKPQWSSTAPEWKLYGQLGVAAGLEWAGNWNQFREYPHLQDG